ncbi:MAG: ATP synthase subunit I [Bradyrhizobium sp.]
MSIPSFDTLPAWAVFLGLAAHLGAGFALGILYFRSLWSSARRFTSRGRLVTTIALMIGRVVLIGGVLTLASLEGALPLLTMALGVLVARSVVMNRIREAAP